MRHLRRYPALWLAIVSIGISGIVALFTPLPQPQFHDEFSYLLAGDTLARGRLSNPPHPLWEFFESFQIIQRPTYASKYPPGQGLGLALGKVVFDQPIVGVWISTALAVAAVWWGLRGFVSRGWATVGALIATTHPLMLQWNWSYWGGSLAAIGGALVVGGIARRSILGGCALGIGLFILAISRPFEGMVLALLSLFLINRDRHAKVTPKFLAVLGITVIASVAWLGYYNWRVTGNALKLPYSVYESQYAVCPPAIWWPRTGSTPQYANDVMRDYYLDWELPQYQRQRTFSGFTAAVAEKLWSFARAYFWSIALLLPAGAAMFCKDRRALIIAFLFTLIVLGDLWFFPHYCAPAVVIYLLVIVRGMQWLETLRHGRWIVGSVIGLHVLAAVVWIAAMDRSGEAWNHRRAEIIEAARNENRRLLVIVRPGAGYYPHNEWVYNDADIDASPVVWARDRGEDNRRLLEYFANREVLLLEIDATSMRLSDYPR